MRLFQKCVDVSFDDVRSCVEKKVRLFNVFIFAIKLPILVKRG